MFIYHFSRLIKSKLIWGLLALLMVFAFVVADSCRSAAPNANVAGFLDGNAVTYQESESAAKTLSILSEYAYFLPPSAQIFGALMRTDPGESDEAAQARRQAVWKLLAAREVAVNHGLTTTQAGAEQVLARFFTDGQGVFNPGYYRAFLSRNNYAEASLFEKTFATVWLPAQTMTSCVFNAVGWVSPMEQDFLLDALYDTTTLYTATLKNTLKVEEIETPEAEVQAWYDGHAESYTLPEQRTIAYVEVPASAFEAQVTIEEMDAMQYYDDHSEEFKGTGTNATQVLPYEEVKEQVMAKARAEKALELAQTVVNEQLVAKAQVAGLAEAAKDYGEPKQTTVRQDRPFGFQNATELIGSVFEMDETENNFNAVSGTDRVYLVQLQKITAKHVEPLADVKSRVQADLRRDLQAKRQKTNGEALRTKLLEALATESAFDKAVAACNIEGLTASTATTCVLSDSAKLEIPNRAEVMSAVGTLGVKALSEPILLPGNDLLFVYVADRQAGDALQKTTRRTDVAQPRTAFLVAEDWLTWNLARQSLTNAEGYPLFAAEEDAPAAE